MISIARIPAIFDFPQSLGQHLFLTCISVAASRIGWATDAAAAFLMKNQTRKWTSCLRCIRRLLSSLDSYPSRRSAISVHALSRLLLLPMNTYTCAHWSSSAVKSTLGAAVRSEWLSKSEDFTSAMRPLDFTASSQLFIYLFFESLQFWTIRLSCVGAK